MRSMMEASVVDFPDPVGPVTRTRPRGSLAIQSATGGRAELVEGRDVGGDHAERQRHLALLGEGAATEAGPVVPGEGEVDVLILVEGLLVLGESMPRTIDSIWSPVSASVFSIALSFPSTLILGSEPAASKRSEPCWSHRTCSHGEMVSMSASCFMGSPLRRYETQSESARPRGAGHFASLGQSVTTGS